MLLLSVPGTKNTPKPVEVKQLNGDEWYRMRSGGIIEEKKKIFKTDLPDGRSAFLIHGSSERELNKLVSEVKKKLKEFTYEIVKPAPGPNDYPVGSMVEVGLSTGGELIHKGVARIAVNFYAYSGLDRQAMPEICSYILGQKDGFVVNPFFPNEAVWSPLPPKAIAHSLLIQSIPNQGLLVAIVELFNVHRYYVILNRFYIGPEICESYSFDILNRAKINRQPLLSLGSREQFFQHDRPTPELAKRVYKEWHSFMDIACYNILKPHIGKTYVDSADPDLNGTTITPDNIEDLARRRHKSLGSPNIRKRE